MTVEMPPEIWANPVLFGDGVPLAGEWNHKDVGEPEDVRYVRGDLDYNSSPAEDITPAKAAQVLLDEIKQIEHPALRHMEQADCCEGPTVSGDYLAMLRAALRSISEIK